MQLAFDTPPRLLTLTADECARLCKPLGALVGGWQSLLLDWRNRLHGDTLEATDAELQRAYQYAYGASRGGFQDIFRAVLQAARRAGFQAR